MSDTDNTTVTLTRKDVEADGFDFRAAAKAIRDRKDGLTTADGYVMFDAALLMGAALDSGKIGKAEDAIWRTQGAYATSVGYSSSSQQTILPRLAKAIRLGIKVGTPQWTFLTRFGDSARVGAVVKGAETGKALRDGIAPLMAEAKKTGKVSKGEGETRGAQSTAAEKEADKAPVVPPKPTVKDVLHVLHTLRVPCHDLSDEQWSEVRDAMEKFTASEDNRRALLNAKAVRTAKAEAEKAAKAEKAA